MLMKLKNIKSLNFAYFAIFFTIIISIVLLVNNSDIESKSINKKWEERFFPKTASSNVTILSPTQDTYGPSPIVINTSISNDTTMTSVVANINATISFNLTMSNPLDIYWNCTWNNVTSYPSGDYNITIIAIGSDLSVNQSQFVIINIDNDPNITIISPKNGDIFNSTAPGFNIINSDDTLNYTWYTLGANTTKHFFTDNGTINQIAWNLTIDGYIEIRFYANDTAGNEHFENVFVIKDTGYPIIIIHSPTSGSVFNSTAPSFNVENRDLSLNYTWYTIGSNTTKHFFTDNGTINQLAWNLMPEGAVTITFFANDTEGNLNSDDVIIIKDTINPTITINFPGDGKVFNDTAPSFNVENLDANLNYTWYTLGANTTKHFFTNNGTINQLAWSLIPEGSVDIRFFANDTAGNEHDELVIVIKDTINPTITINSPLTDETFNATAPDFNVTIIDANLNYTWYTLGTNTTKLFFTNNGTINQLAWNLMPEGSVEIRFYANDTAGNEQDEYEIVLKIIDTTPPNITIIYPSINGTIITNVINITAIIEDLNAPVYSNVSVSIYKNSTYNFVLLMFPTSTLNQWTVQWANLSNCAFGIYNISITAIDSSYLHNLNTTDNITIEFKHDSIPPEISYSSDYNNLEITGDTFEIYVNITDDYSFPQDGDVFIALVNNPTLFNTTMQHLYGNIWYYHFFGISSYENGQYEFRIYARDSSIMGNSTYVSIPFSINIPRGGFDPFLIILIVLIGIAVAVAGATFVLVKKRSHRTRFDEIDRIERLTGESLCERCEYFDAEEQFCNKLLVIKRFDLNAPCKEYKRKSIAPAIEKAKEEFESKVYEPVPGTMCETCQYYNYNTGLCDKYLTFPQLKPNQFCKGYKKFKEEGEKGKHSIKEKISPVKLLGDELCTTCQYQESDTGFCKKFLTYKKLKPTESCKGFKKRKETTNIQE